MKTWATIAAALLALGLAGVAEARGHARRGQRAQQRDVLRGKILSIAADGKSFVVAHKGATTTVTVGDQTRVLLKTAKHEKGQPGTLAALHAGERVRVKPATGTAEKIVILEFARKHRGRG